MVDMPEGRGAMQKGPGQAREVDPCEHHEVQQAQVQSPAPWSGQPRYQCRLGDEEIESSLAEKGVLMGEKLDMS